MELNLHVNTSVQQVRGQAMTDDKSKIKKLCGLVNVEQLLVTVPPIFVKQNKHRERVQVYRNVDYCVVSSHTGCKEITDMPASN